MIKLQEMQNLKLYRNIKLTFPTDSQDVTRDQLLYLNTGTVEDSIDIINAQRFSNSRLFKSYHIQNIYRLKFFGHATNSIFHTKGVYEKIKQSTLIRKLFLDPDSYRGSNLYVDLFKYNEFFFEDAEKSSARGDRLIDGYMELLKQVDSEYAPHYSNRTMIIDLEAWGVDLKDFNIYRYTNAHNPFEFIIHAMERALEQFQQLEFNILLVDGMNSIKIIPKQCDKTSYSELRAQLNRVEQTAKKNRTQPKYIEKMKSTLQYSEDGAKNAVVNDINHEIKTGLGMDDSVKRFSFGGDELEREVPEEIEKKVKAAVDEAIESKDELDDEEIEEIKNKVKEELDEDKELVKNLELVKSDRVANVMSNSNIKRNKMLAEKQAALKVNNQGKTIEQIINEAKEKTITPKKLKVDTINPLMKELTLPNFEKEYNEKLMDKDTLMILNFFKDRSIPVYILDIKKEDTSDQFNKKITYTVKLESADRERHTLKFDLPKFVNHQYLFLNGNKKSLVKQAILKPVSKTGPKTVQVCTNYNKIFISRTGNKLSPKIERLKKGLAEYQGKAVKFRDGDNRLANSDYKTTIEYDELGSNYMTIDIGTKTRLYFNQEEIRQRLKDAKIDYKKDDDILPIGYTQQNGKVKDILYLDTIKDKVIGYDKSVADFIIDGIEEERAGFKEDINKFSVGKRYLYTKAKIMNREVPLILLLAYLEGLTKVLQKAEINFYFSDTRVVLKGQDKIDKDIIPFADGYLVYDRYPTRNSLLMNALSIVNTKDYNYADFDGKDAYLEIFQNLLGVRMIASAFDNFYDLLIDPITKEVLEDLQMPTDFVELLLFANSLLEDNVYTKENDFSLYRIRSNELVNAYLYSSLSKAYERYRMTAGNKNPAKMSIPQDDVIKSMVMSPIVEDYSTLNPILEAEKLRTVGYKGLSGMNMDRAFTLSKRAYDKSMKGILCMSTNPSGAVGVTRELALDANILSPRGYLKMAESDKDLTSTNLFGVSELMVPMCAQKDDSPRTAMNFVQNKHIMPCKKYDPLLVGNGAEKALAHIISDDFVFKAKEDGKVLEVDEELNTIVVQYKSGEVDVIETGSKVSKNSGGGFFIANKLESKLKKGQTFKQDDFLAMNTQFFNEDQDSGATYKLGTLTKLAIMSGYYTYEDSVMITNKMCENMTTNVIVKKDVVLGPNSNIEYMVEKGQHVEVGDPLLVFDNSYDDEGLNKVLAAMDEELSTEITKLSKIPVKSKYSGTIEDIKIYITVDINELSPSIQNVIKKINAPIIKKGKLIGKHTDVNQTNISSYPITKTETSNGKIKGVEIGEGILIEFYINYEDRMGVGDKLTFFTALKGIVCEVTPEGLEPFSEHRPDEEVSAFLSPISILSRMTGSVMVNMSLNKVLIELKHKMKEIAES